MCQTPLWQDARDSGSKPKPGEKYPPKNPRVRLDEYLKRHFPDRVYLLIWDEAHEAQHGDTGNGQSFGRLAGTARKVLAMTGTPFNGRSSSLFNLEYHLNPRVRQQYNWGGARRWVRKARGSRSYPIVVRDTSQQRGRAESRWVNQMGVREQVIEERPTYDKETGAFTGTTTYERPFQESPGISPQLVAELLDHSLFFSLGDLGKNLPEFEEIALPVEPDSDVADLYEQTQQQLKDYLIQRRWEGDSSFRGAYLQWSMGWSNTPHLPYAVIHNLKDRLSGQVRSHTVRQLESLGSERIYAKEQTLLDLVRDELVAGRPCVIYVRQTQTRDLQPRLLELLQRHVPDAKPYILKNTVAAEKREATIERQVQTGMNILITNPELCKTGLDLLFAPTLIFYEPTFNLSTMMQAAARSYRLNQTHALCKVIYLFYQGTMEHHAIQLMSRKQRAAKLLNGEIGLSGLDALTENEGGLEEALLKAIGQSTELLDPAQLFKTDHVTSALDAEDAAFWNVAAPAEVRATPEVFALPAPTHPQVVLPATSLPALSAAVAQKLATLPLPAERLAKVQARVLLALEPGSSTSDPVHVEVLTRWLTKYLRSEKAVNADAAPAFAVELVALVHSATASPEQPLKPEIIQARPKKIKLDLMAIPDDLPTQPAPKSSPKHRHPVGTTPSPAAQQLHLFDLPAAHV